MRTLLVNGHVYSLSEIFASALLVEDGTIAWIGSEGGAQVHQEDVDDVIDLDGDLLAPGFVHLADPEPPANQGYVEGIEGVVQVADQWTAQRWEEASREPLGVVPRDPCRLRSRISSGAPTALVPLPDDSDAWACLSAAVHGIAPEERISARAAFSALTRGAWRLLGHPERGVLAVGAEATFVQWGTRDLVVETPDERISNWSTDPRSPTPGLPPLGEGSAAPVMRRMWRRGILQ